MNVHIPIRDVPCFSYREITDKCYKISNNIRHFFFRNNPTREETDMSALLDVNRIEL